METGTSNNLESSQEAPKWQATKKNAFLVGLGVLVIVIITVCWNVFVDDGNNGEPGSNSLSDDEDLGDQIKLQRELEVSNPKLASKLVTALDDARRYVHDDVLYKSLSIGYFESQSIQNALREFKGELNYVNDAHEMEALLNVFLQSSRFVLEKINMHSGDEEYLERSFSNMEDLLETLERILTRAKSCAGIYDQSFLPENPDNFATFEKRILARKALSLELVINKIQSLNPMKTGSPGSHFTYKQRAGDVESALNKWKSSKRGISKQQNK